MQHHYLREDFHFSENYTHLALHRLFFTMSVSLFSVFIPIYLLDRGFSFPVVLQYLLIMLASSLISVPILRRVAVRFGVLIVVLAGMAGIFSFQIFLGNVSLANWVTFSIIQGVVFRAYWIGMMPIFLLNTEKGKRGSEIGILTTLNQFSGLIGPVAGGIIATLFGFKWMFFIAGLLLLLGMIPILDGHHTLTTNKGKRLTWKSKATKILISSEGALIYGASELWPLAMFFLVEDFITLGGLATLQSLGGMITALAIGWLADHTKRRNVIWFGALFGAAVWFVRPYALTLMDGALYSFFGGMGVVATTLPFFISITDRMEGLESVGAMAWREKYVQAGKVITAMVFLLAFTHTQNIAKTFEIGFIFLGIISLLFLFYQKEKFEKRTE